MSTTKIPRHYHPLLFNDEMVCAILAGRKGQTRRLRGLDGINAIAEKDCTAWEFDRMFEAGGILYAQFYRRLMWCQIQQAYTMTQTCQVKCPWGNVGHVIWGREAWEAVDCDPGHQFDQAPGEELREPLDYGIVYRADGDHGDARWCQAPKGAKCIAISDPSVNDHWRPSIHMNFWACRLFLKIKSIRVERIWDINHRGAKAEGVQLMYRDDGRGHRNEEWIWAFRKLWDSINADRFPWDSNPWVWVVEFERYER